MTSRTLRLGVAGWSVGSRYARDFPAGGSQLERYARIFSAVEITSSFHRHHEAATYRRWAQSVGPDFSFSVKTPKALTHHGGLLPTDQAVLDRFLTEIAGLGPKLRVLLVQLPPSLEFVASDAHGFFADLRRCIAAGVAIVCEPRHPSWRSTAVESFLNEQGVSRVAVDPARWTEDGSPGGERRLAYFRMHGAPRIYFSHYTPQRLEDLACGLQSQTQTSDEVWCIFDNTAHGHALGNALVVRQLLNTVHGESVAPVSP